MSRLKFCFVTCLMLLVCSSCFAKAPALTDIWPELLDVLPWYADSAGYERQKEIEKIPDGITGENPDKEREGEEKVKENERKKAEEEQKEAEKTEGTAEKKDVAVTGLDIVVILDKSGSMYSMQDDTIGGFNSFLDEQRKKDVPARITVAMFNQAVETKRDRLDMKEMGNLTKEDYVPQGTTALYDAVGNTLSALRTNKEVNADGNKVMVVIITDGMENASKEWTKDMVKKLLTELQDEKGYEVVFLGADIDAMAVGQGIGVKQQSSVKFKKTGGVDGGVRANFKAISVMADSVSAGHSLNEESALWKRSIVEDK